MTVTSGQQETPAKPADAERAGRAPKRVFLQLNTTASFPYPASWYLRRLAWEIVRRTVFRFSLTKFNGWRRFWLRVFGATVADTSVIRPSALIRHPWLFTMGEWTCIAEEVEIYNLGPVTIGDHTVISQYAYLCNGTHDYTKPNLPLVRPECRIGSGVWVCADAFIGPGVTIGDNSIVGARAVVMKDVPEAVIVSGNPAKVVRARPMGEEKEPQMNADERR